MECLEGKTTWNLIKHKIDNGLSTHLWWDNWHPTGLLMQKYGNRIIYGATFFLNAKVACLIVDSTWRWPPVKSDDLVAIQVALCIKQMQLESN